MKTLEEVIKDNFFLIGKKRTRIFPDTDFAYELRYQSNALNFKDIKDINGLLEKVTSFLYYLTSCYQSKLKDNGSLTLEVKFNAVFPEVNVWECSCLRLIDIYQSCISCGEDGINSLSNIKSTIEELKNENRGYTAIIIAPFELNINIIEHKSYSFRPFSFGEDREEEEEEEEEEKRVIIINTDKSFKSDGCVICLTNQPNVLFCNCGHKAICEECGRTKSLNACPICKTKITIKRIV